MAIQPGIPLHGATTQTKLVVPAKGVAEAEGRDREQVGEEVTMGKRLTGTPNKNMKNMTLF